MTQPTHHRDALSAEQAGAGCGEYTFRAPRWSDLTRCPVCGTTPDDFGACDYCGSEGLVFKETTYGYS